MTTLRALGAVRLSKESDASTSPARQREKIEWWAEGHSCQLIHVTQDLGVSGAVSPFERDELGAWLTDARAGDWDVLLAWKLDRISRSAEDTLKLLNWCTKHGKRIVCVDDGIDTDTEMGKVWIQLAAIFAQVERTAIRERTLGSREKLRKTGRWAGGAPVYGLRAVADTAGSGYVVKHDPETYPTLRWIVERTIAGDSLNSIAKRLNAQGEPTPQDVRRRQKGEALQGAKWRTSTLKSILTSPTLLGHMSHKGETVRGQDGMAVKAGDPAVTLSEWKQIKARVVDNVTPRGPTFTSSFLLNIGFCAICGSKLHRQAAPKRGPQYTYYLCSSENGEKSNPCGARRIRADKLNDLAGEGVMHEIGHARKPEYEFVAGADHTAELDEAKHSMQELLHLAGQARSKTAQEMFRAQMDALDTRIGELEQLPNTPDQWIERDTGKTYQEIWDEDPEGRRQLLLDSGVTIKAKEDPFTFEVIVPPDILERLK